MIVKGLKGAAAVVAVAVVMFDGASASAGTAQANLSVTATVASSCTISASTLGFGNYDPAGTNALNPLNAAANINVTCTSGALATVTLGQGAQPGLLSSDLLPLRRMTDGSGNYLSYSLFTDSTRLLVWGNTLLTGRALTGTGASQSVTVYGQVAGAQNVPAGSYADTVVATVTF